MPYRLVVSHASSEQPTTVHAQVKTADHGWITIDDWTHTVPATVSARERRQLVLTESVARGWSPPAARWESAEGRDVVALEPADWRAVLRAAVERRSSQYRAYEAADQAWRIAVADTPLEQVSAIEIAKMAGLTRYRVYQIRDEVTAAEAR